MKKNFSFNKKHLRFFISLVYAFVLTIFFAVSANALQMQKEFDKTLYSNVIRLHIVADSDSEYDQQAKIKIRNEILPYLTSITENARDSASAELLLQENMAYIEDELNSVIDRLGYDYQTEIFLSKEYYPVRKYGLFVFPSGTYTSMRINLGKAEGKNFWCVIYPSVCTELSYKAEEVSKKLSDAGVSDNVTYYICEKSKEIEFKFYFLELLQKLNKNT